MLDVNAAETDYDVWEEEGGEKLEKKSVIPFYVSS
jgi:hypothetical protein